MVQIILPTSMQALCDVAHKNNTRVFIYTIFTDAQSFTCSVGSGGACPVAFCPGDEVTHTCDVGTLMGATEWRLLNGTCDDSVISLNQFGSCSDADGTCGPFSAANDGSDGTNCLVSSLTVTATTDLNNTLIQCSNVDLLNNPTGVGSAVFTIAGWWTTVTFLGGGGWERGMCCMQ